MQLRQAEQDLRGAESAVASVGAESQRLEKRIKTLKEEIKSWENKAGIALDQDNEELAKQATKLWRSNQIALPRENRKPRTGATQHPNSCPSLTDGLRSVVAHAVQGDTTSVCNYWGNATKNFSMKRSPFTRKKNLQHNV